jgi:hypothetical protein
MVEINYLTWMFSVNVTLVIGEKAEMSLILFLSKKIIGIEVKSGSVKNTSGIATFKMKFNPDIILLTENANITWQTFLQLKTGELFD